MDTLIGLRNQAQAGKLSACAFMMPMKDLRTLCPRCRGDYLTAGYRLRLVPGRLKEPCDICSRPGMTFELGEVEKPCRKKISSMR